MDVDAPQVPEVFDLVVANPPFQDRERRNSTPHKLWIDFTHLAVGRLADGGALVQVSPSSFRSPRSKVLALMRRLHTVRIGFDAGSHFPQVGSSFAEYVLVNEPAGGRPTVLTQEGRDTTIDLASVPYLPTLVTPEALSVHRKVVWDQPDKLAVRRDYVTCHNSRLGTTLSREPTDEHVHPVFHTSRQTWWSSVRQPAAAVPKVMWSRSGTTRPFFDGGALGATDMAYWVEVANADEGSALAANLNSMLLRYVLATARWSGFGEAAVFEALPDLPRTPMSDAELFDRFALTTEEVGHVVGVVG